MVSLKALWWKIKYKGCGTKR